MMLRALAAALLLAVTTTALSAESAASATPPRLVVIGATARSSREIIRQALERGHAVVAVARRPGEIEPKDPRVTPRRGDVYETATLEAAISPGDVVISMVGPRVAPDQEVPPDFDLFTTGTDNIIAAMKKRGSRRLLVASSLGVENQQAVPANRPADMSNPATMWLWNSRHLYRDMAEMEQRVRRSGLDHVIFRPPFLVAEPRRGDVRLSVNVDSPKGTMMTYTDFAAFVLDQASDDRHLGQTVGLYTDRILQFGVNADFDELAREAAGKARREAEAR